MFSLFVMSKAVLLSPPRTTHGFGGNLHGSKQNSEGEERQ